MSPVTRSRWVTFGCFGTLVDRHTARPLSDAEPMLAELRARGYRLAVLTNAHDDLFELAHRAFAAPFDLFVTAGRVRGYKPEPWLFRGFDRMTRGRRSDWVHVASSRYHDVAPALALGIKTVWLDRARSRRDVALASAYVQTAAEAVSAVDRLSSGGQLANAQLATFGC